MQNMYLVGMMGSGKTVVAQMLAERLGCGFIDLDDAIVQDQQQSIVDIFAKQGEAYFRGVERAQLKKVLEKEARVIATGGGIVINDENIADMKRTGVIVYLKAPTDVLLCHIKKDQARPLLHVPDPRAALDDIFVKRKHQYEKADYVFTIDDKTPDQVAEGILEMIDIEGVSR